MLLAVTNFEGQDYAFDWLTLAFINAGIAQGKNRRGRNWFLLSLLLGPIALIVLVAFMKKLPSAG